MIARHDFNEQRGSEIIARVLAADQHSSIPSNYVSMTCLSALSLHMELSHKTLIEGTDSSKVKICFFQNDKRMFLDSQTCKVLNLLPTTGK